MIDIQSSAKVDINAGTETEEQMHIEILANSAHNTDLDEIISTIEEANIDTKPEEDSR